ncbi:MAG TPA: hypothetical protein VFB32_12310 [Rudaea sp.]|nr:hypothetical protein [Rudaea sp.]
MLEDFFVETTDDDRDRRAAASTLVLAPSVALADARACLIAFCRSCPELAVTTIVPELERCTTRLGLQLIIDRLGAELTGSAGEERSRDLIARIADLNARSP